MMFVFSLKSKQVYQIDRQASRYSLLTQGGNGKFAEGVTFIYHLIANLRQLASNIRQTNRKTRLAIDSRFEKQSTNYIMPSANISLRVKSKYLFTGFITFS
jgi:putative salt-induced outer membrane protein YdiY